MRWTVGWALGALLLFAGCDDPPPEKDTPLAPPAASQPAKGQPATGQTAADKPSGGTHAVGGQANDITWTKPDAWKEAENKSAMRMATYVVPKAEGDPEDGELSVMKAGGSLDANVKRWEGQFGGSKGKSSDKEVAGLKITVVEISGTFSGGGPMMGGGGEPKDNWMMLAAVAETQPSFHFFKLTGPKKTVEAARADFDALVGSIAKK